LGRKVLKGRGSVCWGRLSKFAGIDAQMREKHAVCVAYPTGLGSKWENSLPVIAAAGWAGTQLGTESWNGLLTGGTGIEQPDGVTRTEEHRCSPPIESMVPARFVKAVWTHLDSLPCVGEELPWISEPLKFAQSGTLLFIPGSC